MLSIRLWPRRAWTCWRLTPAVRSSVAAACLRAWGVIGGSRPALREAFVIRFRSAVGESGWPDRAVNTGSVGPAGRYSSRRARSQSLAIHTERSRLREATVMEALGRSMSRARRAVTSAGFMPVATMRAAATIVVACGVRSAAAARRGEGWSG